jgi:lysozyme
VVIESERTTGRFAPGPSSGGRRRGLLVISGLLAIVVVAGAVFWFQIIPRWRPDLNPGERYGLDVSSHQGRIDWDEVAGDNVSAVYMKATEGKNFVDQRFAENWAGAAKAGIPRGAYHFFSVCSPGAEQAANFLKVVPTDPNALPPAVDLEFADCGDRMDSAAMQRELTTFIETVESKVGKKVVLYAISSFTEKYPLPDGLIRDRWVRRLGKRPVANEWTVWQVSDRSKVKGIGKPVDLDVWRTDPAQL